MILRSLSRAIYLCVLLGVLCLLPTKVFAWGSGIHAYTNYKSLQQIQAKGKFKGIYTKYYVSASLAPDIWWLTSNSLYPRGMEHDPKVGMFMIRRSKTIKQISFALGYLSHITSDGPGHAIYLDPNKDRGHHTLRDGMSGFTLFGSFEGYTHNTVDVGVDVLIGRWMDFEKGKGDKHGAWHWRTFDDEMVKLLQEATVDYAKERGEPNKTPSTDNIRTFIKKTADSITRLATGMGIPAYYAEKSLASENAKTIRSIDDKEFGKGKGPAVMDKAISEAIKNTVKAVFEDPLVAKAIAESQLSDEDKKKLMEGPAPIDKAPEPVAEPTPEPVAEPKAEPTAEVTKEVTKEKPQTTKESHSSDGGLTTKETSGYRPDQKDDKQSGCGCSTEQTPFSWGFFMLFIGVIVFVKRRF